MKLNKKLLALICCGAIVFTTGCANQTEKPKDEKDTKMEQKADEKSAKKEEKKDEKPKSPDMVGRVSLAHPIHVDKEEGTVTVLAQVNGKYFTEPTRHASVFKDGTNGTKSIFTSYATAEQFYNGLIEAGAKPGENMTPDNKEKTKVEGTLIKAEVSWNGAEKEFYDMNEVVKDSNGKRIIFRFGGNLKRAQKVNTGCLTCLDSCPVGIISNESYTYGAVETRGEVKFMGNKDILPEDGTYVAITYVVMPDCCDGLENEED